MTAQFCVKSTQVVKSGNGWKELIGETFGSVDLKTRDASEFFGEIQSARLGRIELTEIISDYEDSKRTRQHVAQDAKEYFVLVLVREGRLRIEQFGRECTVSSGGFALFDLNSPYSFQHAERTDVLDIKIPTPMLRTNLADPYRFAARSRSARSGIGRVTADFICSLASEVSSIPVGAAQNYAYRTADLVGSLFDSDSDELPIGNSAVRSALYRRCVAYIEDHSSESNLAPDLIAKAMGISVRYVHKIFQDAGQSVGEVLLMCRLKRCYSELAEPQKRNVSIKEIALRAGFQSQSHFAAAFKRRYQFSPSDLREVSRQASA